MFAAERRKQILNFITKEGRAEVAELTQQFGVSAMTIRRDLNVLESEGLLARARGGALPNNHFVQEVPYLFKASSNVDIKHGIAEEAESLVKDGDTVILDAGSTTLQIAKQFKRNKKNLTVLTNDLNIALELADQPNIKVFATGGQVQPGTYCLLGEVALEFLRNVSVNAVFLGAGAIDVLGGVYTPTLEKAHLKRTMIGSSAKVILAADHTKFGHRAFAKICGFEAIDIVISNDELAADTVLQLQEMGVEVRLTPTK